MSDTKNLRHYIRIVEGEHIGHKAYSLALDITNYELYRLMQQLANPDSEMETSKTGESAILTFYEEEEYKKIKNLLSKYNINFREIHERQKTETEADNTVSPLPKWDSKFE